MKERGLNNNIHTSPECCQKWKVFVIWSQALCDWFENCCGLKWLWTEFTSNNRIDWLRARTGILRSNLRIPSPSRPPQRFQRSKKTRIAHFLHPCFQTPQTKNTTKSLTDENKTIMTHLIHKSFTQELTRSADQRARCGSDAGWGREGHPDIRNSLESV